MVVVDPSQPPVPPMAGCLVEGCEPEEPAIDPGPWTRELLALGPGVLCVFLPEVPNRPPVAPSSKV